MLTWSDVNNGQCRSVREQNTVSRLAPISAIIFDYTGAPCFPRRGAAPLVAKDSSDTAVIRAEAIGGHKMNDVSEFARKVRKCRQERSPETIENASTAYASVLLEELFGFAQEIKAREVLILSGRLIADVYDKLVGRIKSLLDSGCQVRVIALSSEADMEQNEFYKAVRDYGRDRDRGEVACLDQDPRSENHFVVVGDSAYRLETSDSSSTAIASFNDRSGAIPVLKNKFEELWNRARGKNASGNRLFERT